MAVPKLRFRANDGSEFPEWKEKTLGEITQKVVRKADDKSMADVRMISQGNGFILQSKKYSRENAGKSLKKYTLLKKNEFAYNHGASKVKPYGVCYRLIESDETRVPYVYHTFRLKNGNEDYWNYALNTSEMDKQLKKMVSSGVRMDGLLNINYETYMSVKVLIPSLPEQRKIADLLSAVDDVISAQEAEVAAWEKRKKGVMQKLFSQEVRFKADDGSEFPEWKEKTLGEICEQLKASIDPRNNPTKQFIEYSMPAYDNHMAAQAVLGQSMNSARKILSAPCVLINKLNVRKRRIWVVEYPEDNAVCSSEFVPLTSTEFDLRFLGYLAMTDSFTGYLLDCSSGSSNSQKRVTPDTILQYLVSLPSLSEQRKIADCLTSLDDVIAKAKDELDAWQELKKGLLQQMFV